MQTQDPKYGNYLQILKEELVPAMGCTEPAAIAYAAALARKELGRLPGRVLIEVSGNIVKNVKSVVVPNTGGLKGIEAAAAAGIIAGKAEKKLEVISQVGGEQKKEIEAYLKSAQFEVRMADTGRIFDIIVTCFSGDSSAKIQIADFHTNVILVEKDGKILCSGGGKGEEQETDRSLLSVESIIDFADTLRIEDVREIIERQIDFNSAISAEGLRGKYGANIGRVLRNGYGNDIKVRAKAAAAAGSDARMSGCELPVIILSGSGNQGMTASLPVIEYAKEFKTDRDDLIRSLVVADLITIHLKTGIGRLSAYCGVVSAGAGAGAGIAYLHGGRMEEIAHTIVNALAIDSGMVCDGAKPSCAAKIATAVDAGIMGYEMYKNGQQFYGGDGIIVKGVENTIKNINRLGKEGMRETDKEIIRIMLNE
ncbi:membrane protein [Spirochaetia bacterium]|nr:membrane protein [Spirochaetia bacterium]